MLLVTFWFAKCFRTLGATFSHPCLSFSEVKKSPENCFKSLVVLLCAASWILAPFASVDDTLAPKTHYKMFTMFTWLEDLHLRFHQYLERNPSQRKNTFRLYTLTCTLGATPATPNDSVPARRLQLLQPLLQGSNGFNQALKTCGHSVNSFPR